MILFKKQHNIIKLSIVFFHILTLEILGNIDCQISYNFKGFIKSLRTCSLSEENSLHFLLHWDDFHCSKLPS